MLDFIHNLGIEMTTPMFQLLHIYITNTFWAIFVTCFLITYPIERLHAIITDYPMSAFKTTLILSFITAYWATAQTKIDTNFGSFLFTLIVLDFITTFLFKDFLMAITKD